MIIYLTQGATAEIDDDDWELIKNIRWHLHKSRHRGRPIKYARGKHWGHKVYLHRYIMNTKNLMQVEHKDGNGLNCKRSNMMNVTAKENNKLRDKRRRYGNSFSYAH